MEKKFAFRFGDTRIDFGTAQFGQLPRWRAVTGVARNYGSVF